MADDPTPPVDPEGGDDDGDKGDPPVSPPDDLGDAGRRALEAERRARRDVEARYKAKLKELEPLAQRAKELEDSKKSDTERLSEERDAHRSRADKVEKELGRFRVALRHRLNEKQAGRLKGETEEELEADALDYLDELRLPETPGKEPPAPGRTKERLRPGAVPDAEPVELDPAKLAQMVSRNQFG